MFAFFKAHRVLAIIVLVAAVAWVATGEFSAVGSEEAKSAEIPSEPAAATPPALLRTVAAVAPEFADHARQIRISGATEADKRAVLAARADGIVAALDVVQGAEVSADTIVMRLEGAELAAVVETATASLVQATEQLDVGMALSAKGSLPELELTNRRAAKSAAEAALSQAQAAADRLLLKAPFDGIVDTVDVELGEWVQAGAPITTILSLDPIVVTAEVSELDVAYVAVGSPATVRLVSGAEMQGTIRHVARQASEETRTFALEVALPNPDRTIPAGMTAEISVFAAPQTAVTVPRSVITMSDAGVIGVRVVGADNVAQFVPVQLIDDTEAGMIISGVPADVRIITAGQDLVRDGDQVIVVDAPAAPAIEGASE